MPNKEPYELLKNAPAQDSPEFLQYLRDNNEVVYENEGWLIIENCKYHTPERPWHTAFWKLPAQHSAINGLSLISFGYWDWEWLKKAKSKQTVPGRFHIHLIRR